MLHRREQIWFPNGTVDSHQGDSAVGNVVNLFVVNSVPEITTAVVLPPGTILIQKVPIQPPPPRAGPIIIGHCIFCFRQLVEATHSGKFNGRKNPDYDNELQIVQKADISPLKVSTFNMVLPHLHEKWMRRDDEYGTEQEERKNGNGEGPSLPKKFPHLPAMCRFCGNKFLELDKVIQEMKARIQDLRKIINDSKLSGKYFWRWEQFVKDLTANPELTKESIKKTFDFYEGFGVFEDKDDEPRIDDYINQASAFDPLEDTINMTVETEKVEVKMETDDKFIDESIDDEFMSPPFSPIEDSLATSPAPLPSPAGKRKIILKKPATTKRAPAPPKKKSRRRRPPKPKKTGPLRCKVRCEFCPLTLPTSEIRDHLQLHVKNYLVPCPNPSCDRAFSTPLNLGRHLRLTHACQKAAHPSCQCRKTKKRFYCKCKHNEEKCEICDFRTTSGRFLTAHLNTEHEDLMAKNFFCPIAGCEEGFTLKQSVYCHLYGSSHKYDVIHPSIQKCAECGLPIKIDEMTNHLQTCHQISKVITCKQCPFMFPTWELLIKHLYCHRDNPEAFTCYLCNDGVHYALHKSLRYHFFVKHQVGKILSCAQCRRFFFTEMDLEKHQKLRHSNDLPLSIGVVKQTRKPGSGRLYICGVTGCGKVFNEVGRLRVHKVLKHSGLGCGYKCEVEGCGKSFSSLKKLEDHEEVIHLGRRKEKLMCEECGEYFAGREVLRTHKLIHTGERPYQCTHCGQRFRHCGVLKTHMESHERKGGSFKPNGPMKHVRKRVRRKESF